MLRLYDYWRSSAAYRVRIALNLKELNYDSVAIDLARGEHADASHARRNPQGLVPVLEHDGRHLTQSLAIIEYLEEMFPPRRLLPADPVDVARVRAMAQLIACDIHPLNNLRVLKYLVDPLGAGEQEKRAWYHHWVATGFSAFEKMLEDPRAGDFCHGDQPGLADVCLIPQVYNARRFECDLDAYPRIRAVEAACLALDAFTDASPERQADAS
ncbi:MAG: maleylacetoacetate isomerase [Gammaproteobacteria bacterium]|nr:maleylacetoacetate isomerase [Gammaproteobacteria bacterium]